MSKLLEIQDQPVRQTLSPVERLAYDQIQACVVTLKGKVLNKPVEFIIDRGQRNLSFLLTLYFKLLFKPSEIKFNGVDGKSIQTFGHFNAVVCVPSLRHEFKMNFVVTKTQYILGADFLLLIILI